MFRHILNSIRYKCYKLKNIRFILERIPFFFKKCTFSPDEFDYAEGMENFYLYNELIGFCNSLWKNYNTKSLFSNLPKNYFFGWYRSTFTWLRYLLSFRTSRFLSNFCLSHFTKYFWCVDLFTLDLNNFFSKLWDVLEYIIDSFTD